MEDENRIFKVVKIGISDKKLSHLLWVVVATKSKITSYHSVGMMFMEKPERKKCSGFGIDFMISIPESNFEYFKEIIGFDFREPIKIALN